MSRSATTGIYTRVSNSFSEPVVGTTISPTDADTFFDDVESCMNSFIGTSTTSLLIAVASKTFVTQLTKTFIPGTFVHAFSLANSANYMFGTVTSYSAVNGNLVVDVTAIGGSGTLADWVIMQAGARGAIGATGSTGPTSGVKYTYSTTTADADPGAGIFRLNNATVASATAAYIDNADSDGNTVTAWLDSFDDSTTTAKGTLVLRGITTPAALAIFAVTGSVVDGTGYRKLTLTYVAGGGTFTNAESFAFNFLRTGDKGSDGAGTGDVVGPAASIDSEIALFDLTTGKLLKRASLTGIVKATAGVAAAAVAGDGDAIVTDASATAKGKVELATDAETQTGTDTARAITPANLTAKEATAANYQANLADRILTTDIVWSSATEVTLTDAATVAVDMNTFINAVVTLAGNRAMGNPTNEKPGQTGYIRIVQDATGTRTLSYGTDWEFAGGSAPVLSTAANAQDVLFYTVIATNRIFASLVKAIA